MKQAEYSRKIFQILSHLRIIVNNVRLYSLDHYQVEVQVGQVFKEFISAFSVRPEITLLVIENDLIINNKAIPAQRQKNFSLFVKILQEKEVGFVTFSKGMKKSELRLFLEHLAAPDEETVPSFSSPCIQVGRVGLKKRSRTAARRGSGSEKDGVSTGLRHGANQAKDKYRDEEIKEALSTLNSMATDRLDIIKEYYDKMKRSRHCDTRDVEDVISVFVQCFSKNMNPLALLSTMKEADEYSIDWEEEDLTAQLIYYTENLNISTINPVNCPVLAADVVQLPAWLILRPLVCSMNCSAEPGRQGKRQMIWFQTGRWRHETSA